MGVSEADVRYAIVLERLLHEALADVSVHKGAIVVDEGLILFELRVVGAVAVHGHGYFHLHLLVALTLFAALGHLRRKNKGSVEQLGVHVLLRTAFLQFPSHRQRCRHWHIATEARKVTHFDALHS